MKPEDRLADIQSLQEDLLEFERKYGMRSEEFYAAYSRGEEPENSEWVLDFGGHEHGKMGEGASLTDSSGSGPACGAWAARG